MKCDTYRRGFSCGLVLERSNWEGRITANLHRKRFPNLLLSMKMHFLFCYNDNLKRNMCLANYACKCHPRNVNWL